MKKLKNKVFYTIFLILTLSLFTFIFLLNLQNYFEQKDNIMNSLNTLNKNNDFNKDIKDDRPDIKFMDSLIYTVLIDENDNIKEVINHSNNGLSTNEVRSVALKILNSNIKDKYISNLYFSNYSYSYFKGDSLVIVDNSKYKNILLKYLYISILIFILFEILFLFISKLITNWIIKPVIDSFNKQKTFIEDASHELKTPLAVILASIDAYLKNNDIKWINNIKAESDRMNLLITDLLELASTEKKETFNFENRNLSKIVELSALTFDAIAYDKNIKIKYFIDKDIYMKCDDNSIKQLVEILLDNAIKHSNKIIELHLNLENNNIILKVINDGEEIKREDEEKIFERFYRVDKSRNRSTNRYGLGLAIAKNIVLNHNGRISASSSNHITTFKIVFKKV